MSFIIYIIHRLKLRSDAPFPIADFEYGPFFYVHALYLFMCLSISIIILSLKLKKATYRFKMQILSMIAGLVVPVAGNHFYLNDLSPYGIDLGPVSMSISFNLHGISLFSFQMFNVVPIARGKVFENMSDGVIVLDEKGLIVDYNKAALNIIPTINASSIGKNIDGLLANNKILADLFSKREECDYEYSGDFPHSHVQIRFTPIVTGHNNVLGTIVTFADITESIRMQEKLRQLASYDGLTQFTIARFLCSKPKKY